MELILRKTNNDVSTPNVSNSNSYNVDNIPLEPVTATIFTAINGAVSVVSGFVGALESLLDFAELVTAGIGMTLAGGVADLLDLASYGSEWEGFKWTKELLSGLLEYVGIDHVGECVSEWYDAGGFLTMVDDNSYFKHNSLLMKGIKKISKYATQVILAWLTGGLIEGAAAAGIIDEGSSLLVAGSHAFTLITSFMTYADAFPETYEMLIEIETSANFDNALKEYSSNNSGTSLSKILTEEIELMKNDSEYAGEPISLEDAAEHFYERLELELETQAEKDAKNNGWLIVEAFAVASAEAAINAIFVEASSYYSELATANLEHAFTKDYVLENAKKVLFTAIIKQGRTFMNEMIKSCIDGDLTIEDALSALDTYFQSIAGEIIGQYVKSDAEAFLQKYGFISIEKLERYMRMRHSTDSENNSSEENFSFDLNSNPDYGAGHVEVKSSDSIDLLYKNVYAGMKEMGIAPEKLTGKAANEYLKLLCPYIEKIVQIPVNATEEEVDEFYLNLVKAIFEYNEAA